MDLSKYILDIVVLDGQSNAEGNGLSSDETAVVRGDCVELIDCNNCWVENTIPHQPVIHMTLPVQCRIQPLQERYSNTVTASHLGLSFADEYIKAGLVKKGHLLMIIRSAVGGTGFALNQQNVGGDLHKRTLGMIDQALSFNKENRIVAYLWHQGEHDAYENIGMSYDERYAFYHKEFMAKMNDIMNRYSQFKFPIIAGEFCNDWSDLPDNKEASDCIEQCLRDCMKEIGYAAMVGSEGLHSNRQDNGGDDYIHFSKNGILGLGRRYFRAYKELTDK